MAQQDKTDFYWNGVLSGAINNLYYDLINVDVVHVPYATTHRNSSFFLKTRWWYNPQHSWASSGATDWYDVTDLKIVRDNKCDKNEWMVFAMGRKKWWLEKTIFIASIEDSCVWTFNTKSGLSVSTDGKCDDWKMFLVDYVKWSPKTNIWWGTIEWTNWIQINAYEGGKTVWYFSTDEVEEGTASFTSNVKRGDYLVVWESLNADDSWFAGQVRMITWIDDSSWRIMVNEAWQGFKTLSAEEVKEKWTNEVSWSWLKFSIYRERWDVVWFTNDNNVYIITNPANWDVLSFPWISSISTTDIVWTATTGSKIFFLTDNGYIHYTNTAWWYDKMFINEDMFAWVDKTSLVAYRDFLLAFGRNHIAVWVPDDTWTYYTMYNQSNSIWLRSRYSYWEYDWDLLFVSNDKRLLALWVSATAWRYMLQHEDVWDMLNWKLAALVDTDEVFIWSNDNNLRVFVNTKPTPYVIKSGTNGEIILNESVNNTMTHIYKFDTLFKVRSEDHIPHFLLRWADEGVYFGEWGIYVKNWDSKQDTKNVWTGGESQPVTTTISAYLVENENNWLEWRPTLFQLAKLNRIITTLWPGIYSDTSKIKVTSYSKWIWLVYEFPINGDWNKWLEMITDSYVFEQPEIDDCTIESLISDPLKQYQPRCDEAEIHIRRQIPKTPRCKNNVSELIAEDHWVCYNDKLYELAPTMPLATSLGENQPYSTQIKIELIWWQGDVICFGWRLAEMYIAPLFLTWPDWEYQLEPNTACR